MDIKIPPLSAYPAGIGPNIAKQVQSARELYRARIEAVRAELRASEEAFADGFARADVASNARDRVAALAKTNRQATRRG
ncbi:hypothetical protein [Microterricola pindariensis]|uniref:Antitoxin VbhA domain-containing protein n=1 Tax=Microterricola pindariensis TaxID=478010 RepID=A0ABX5AVA9_9MICO|nr:hypothetical protein [Microterricola pindariensis]PPL17960.1 hypothetical protein GY24_10900 [Microterricola pindariensis]